MRFGWSVYQNSRISKIRSPILRKCFLFVRNVYCQIIKVRQLKRIFIPDPYQKLVNEKYSEAIKLSIFYIHSAAVDGDTAEFGTHGVTASIMAKQLVYNKLSTTLHLFDSFEGFPKLSAMEDLNSPHVRSKVWREGTSAGSISAAKLKKSLQRKLSPEQVKIYEGWYENTLPTIPEKTKFAMLLMDCCLYASHSAVLTPKSCTKNCQKRKETIWVS